MENKSDANVKCWCIGEKKDYDLFAKKLNKL